MEFLNKKGEVVNYDPYKNVSLNKPMKKSLSFIERLHDYVVIYASVIAFVLFTSVIGLIYLLGFDGVAIHIANYSSLMLLVYGFFIIGLAGDISAQKHLAFILPILAIGMYFTMSEANQHVFENQVSVVMTEAMDIKVNAENSRIETKEYIINLNDDLIATGDMFTVEVRISNDGTYSQQYVCVPGTCLQASIKPRI